MKKLLSILLVLLTVTSLIACSNGDNEAETSFSSGIESSTVTADTDAQSETEANSEAESVTDTDVEDASPSECTPLLYKVTDDSGNTAWLFGSIHIGRESFYPLPDYVMDAYNSSDSLAVELDSKAFEKDLSAQVQAMSLLVDRSGSRIDRKIDKELYDECVRILKDNNSYVSAFDMYQPILWFVYINTLQYRFLPVDTKLGIDNHFINLAYEENKPILEVESPISQYTMFASFSEELQVRLLESIAESYKTLESGDEEYIAENVYLLDLWASGDEDTFAKYLVSANGESFEDSDDIALYEEYEKKLITDRNITMTDFAEDALASGDEVFICVGAAHVVGEGAMADLLAKRGYTVTLVK